MDDKLLIVLERKIGHTAQGKELIHLYKAGLVSLDSMVNTLYEIQARYERKLNEADMRDETNATVAFANVWPSPESASKLSSILASNYQSAVTLYKEFSEYPLFKKSLDKFFKNPSTEMFSVNFGPASKNVGVYIRAAEIAGGPEVLGEAVTAARETMKTWVEGQTGKEPTGKTLSGPIASLIWYIKLYRTARGGKIYWEKRKDKDGNEKKVFKHEKTKLYREYYKEYMRARMEQIGDLAPHWYLLENGNKSVSLTSDKGGAFGDPQWEPTYFVSRSARECEEYLESRFNQEYSKISGSVKGSKRWTEIINDCYEAREHLYQRIEDAAQEQERDLLSSYPFSWDAEVAKDFFTDVKDIIKEASADTDLEEKANLKMIIIIEKLLLGEVPESGRMYFMSVKGKESRMNVSKALQELKDAHGENERIIRSLEKLKREDIKSDLIINQTRMKEMLAKAQRKRNS